MSNKLHTYTRLLTTLVVTCVVVAFAAQPVAAQTAKKLKCNGCVKSKQLKNGGIKSKDIGDGQVGNADLANNAVNSGNVADESLTAVDLGDEAGVEFAGGGGLDFLTTTAAVIETVTLSAPSSGFVIVHANGTFQFNSPATIERAECSIATGTAIDDANQITAGELTANAVFYEPFASTRVFSASVGGGSATYNLVCVEIFGDMIVRDTYLTALFVPTRY